MWGQKLMADITRDDIFEILKGILVDDFDIVPENVVLDADLFEDLELDSVDAVDLAVRLQQHTGKKVSPAEFKQIRTVADVVNAVEKLLQE